MVRNLFAALAPLALFVLPSTPSAQCLGADGLTGPCCTAVAANLPNFGSAAPEGTAICWVDCDPQTQQLTRVQIDTPVQSACGQYKASIVVSDGVGTAILVGSLVMDYTRTWEEVTPGAIPRRLQVYRFVVKVDLVVSTPGVGNTCNVPACAAVGKEAFYYGYMDYAYDCTTAAVEHALVLFHNCDAYIHDLGFSTVPGVFHPSVSYALVYPSTAVNPFVAAYLTAPGGPLFGEATRLEPPAGTFPCLTEDPLSSGDIFPLGDGCVCFFAAAPLQVTARQMRGKGTCLNAAGKTSLFLSLNAFPTYPWYEVLTTSIGTWTTAASYPGPEFAWVDEDVFFVRDICSQATGSRLKFVETYYGASTQEGFQVVPSTVNPTITQRMTDLASNHSYAFPGGIGPIWVGSVVSTRNLIYLNY